MPSSPCCVTVHVLRFSSPPPPSAALGFGSAHTELLSALTKRGLIHRLNELGFGAKPPVQVAGLSDPMLAKSRPCNGNEGYSPDFRRKFKHHHNHATSLQASARDLTAADSSWSQCQDYLFFLLRGNYGHLYGKRVLLLYPSRMRLCPKSRALRLPAISQIKSPNTLSPQLNSHPRSRHPLTALTPNSLSYTPLSQASFGAPSSNPASSLNLLASLRDSLGPPAISTVPLRFEAFWIEGCES